VFAFVAPVVCCCRSWCFFSLSFFRCLLCSAASSCCCWNNAVLPLLLLATILEECGCGCGFGFWVLLLPQWMFLLSSSLYPICFVLFEQTSINHLQSWYSPSQHNRPKTISAQSCTAISWSLDVVWLPLWCNSLVFEVDADSDDRSLMTKKLLVLLVSKGGMGFLRCSGASFLWCRFRRDE